MQNIFTKERFNELGLGYDKTSCLDCESCECGTDNKIYCSEDTEDGITIEQHTNQNDIAPCIDMERIKLEASEEEYDAIRHNSFKVVDNTKKQIFAQSDSAEYNGRHCVWFTISDEIADENEKAKLIKELYYKFSGGHDIMVYTSDNWKSEYTKIDNFELGIEIELESGKIASFTYSPVNKDADGGTTAFDVNDVVDYTNGAIYELLKIATLNEDLRSKVELELLTSEIINQGHDAIADFLDYDTNAMSEDDIRDEINDVIAQMPDDILEMYINKYLAV